MILRPQLLPTDEQAVLDYYLAHYAEVHLVTCTKCGSELAIEIRGDVSGYQQNALGFTVLPFGHNLLSSRVRLDGSMGYQCGASVPNPEYPKLYAEAKKSFDHNLATYNADYKLYVKQLKKGEEPHEYEPPQFVFDVPEKVICGNDTRATELEEKMSPDGTFLPHEVHAIKQRQIEIGWKPKVKVKGNIETHETFTRERIK